MLPKTESQNREKIGLKNFKIYFSKKNVRMTFKKIKIQF